MKEFSLKKNERVRRKRDFLSIIKKGTRHKTSNFVAIVYSRKLGKRRLGVSVSRKVGNAVERNRIKRLLREFFRLNKTRLPDSCDILFIAKPGATELNYRHLFSELREIFKKDEVVN